MKRFSMSLFMFLLACTLTAQMRTGNIYGKVVDTNGEPLPGVAVTLTGSLIAPMPTTTSAEGIFRFISLPVAKDYSVKAELQGFKASVRGDIIIALGSNVEIIVTLEQGSLSEEVTVTAATPVVDAKKTSVGVIMTNEMLQSLPSARDPWDILQMAPGIAYSMDNVGGILAGQMMGVYSRAGNGGDNTWSLDGLNVSDPASIGGPSSYWDFDSFEEMNVTTSGSDVTQQTGGFQLNLVTRRGGNKISFGGRFYLIDKGWQADNMTDDLKKEGLPGVNKFDEFRDFGFNIGLPLIKDKAWFWGSYGVQDIQTVTLYGNNDNTLLSTLAAKLNLQLIPQNRLEFFAQGDRKQKKGRDQAPENPQGLLQRSIFHYGFPIYKIQDEHMFGDNFFISAKWGAYNGGFELTPMMDPDRLGMSYWDETAQQYYGPYFYYLIDKWVYNTSVTATYFNDRLFGVSHEIKFGAEYSDRTQTKDQSRAAGNVTITRNFINPQADFTGDGEPDIPTDPNFKYIYFNRGWQSDQGVKAWALYASDNISWKRLNISLGLRYDYQEPVVNALTVTAVEKDAPQWSSKYFATDAVSKLDGLLPGAQIPKVKATATNGSTFAWKDLQPRIGLTYDMFGDGKTIAKLSFSRYASWMGSGPASTWRQNADGWLSSYWWDNGNGIVEIPELYWYTLANYSLHRLFDASGNFVGNWSDAGDTFYGDYDPQNPSVLSKPFASIDANAQTSKTNEFILSLEREIVPDFAVQAAFTYRKYTEFTRSLKYFSGTDIIQNQSWYISAGTPPANIPGLGDTKDAKNHEWYYTSTQGTAYSPYTVTKRTPDYNQTYWGLDIVFNKRLTNKWMFNGSVTFQGNAHHYGSQGYLNPTNIWAYDGQPTSSGFTPFMLKLSGLYQLPYDMNISVSYQGRTGWIIREYFNIVDYRLPNTRSNSASLDMTPYGSDKLPFLHKLNIRLEKMLRIGETGKIYLMADLFNILNVNTATNRQNKFHGTYYIYSDSSKNRWVANVNDFRLDRILNPRVARFGVRFLF